MAAVKQPRVIRLFVGACTVQHRTSCGPHPDPFRVQSSTPRSKLQPPLLDQLGHLHNIASRFEGRLPLDPIVSRTAHHFFSDDSTQPLIIVTAPPDFPRQNHDWEEPDFPSRPAAFDATLCSFLYRPAKRMSAIGGISSRNGPCDGDQPEQRLEPALPSFPDRGSRLDAVPEKTIHPYLPPFDDQSDQCARATTKFPK